MAVALDLREPSASAPRTGRFACRGQLAALEEREQLLRAEMLDAQPLQRPALGEVVAAHDGAGHSNHVVAGGRGNAHRPTQRAHQDESVGDILGDVAVVERVGPPGRDHLVRLEDLTGILR